MMWKGIIVISFHCLFVNPSGASSKKDLLRFQHTVDVQITFPISNSFNVDADYNKSFLESYINDLFRSNLDDSFVRLGDWIPVSWTFYSSESTFIRYCNKSEEQQYVKIDKINTDNQEGEGIDSFYYDASEKR